MSVIGIDIGTSGAVMASVRGGKIQVLRNEISERFTPCLVSYTASGERTAGDVALNAINSNYRSTCRNMKVLLGRRATPDFLESQKHYSLAPISAGPNDHVQFDLPTTDAPVTAIQAMASFIKTLGETAKTFLGSPTLGGVVIAIPSYYTQSRIQALAASAQIAKIHLLNCVKEYMAVAMDYGIYRRKQFDERQPTVTAFVSVGHGYSWVTIAEFTQHYGKVLATACNEELGGRKLDDILIAQMAKKFKDSTGLDAEKNARARLKLETAAQKAKKTLSSNKEAVYGIECLMEGEDINGMLKQDDLVQLASPISNGLKELCRQAISLLPEGCYPSSVELVGNGSRAPVFIQAIEEAFGLTGQRTLSADECVARGCALYAALFSPTIRMKEYPLFDWMNPVPSKLRNPPEPVVEKKEGLLKGFFNSNKTAETKPSDEVPEGSPVSEASGAEGQPMPSGETEPETIPNQTPDATPPAAVEQEEPEEDLTPLPEPEEDPAITAEPLKPGVIRAFEEQEKIQMKKDIDAHRRRNAINAYESTIFYCRDRARSPWPEEIGSQDVINQINEYLNSSEEWLWDHMDEAFTVYEDRLEDLKHYVGQWVNDFKPKPPAPEPAPAETAAPESAEPQVEEPTTEPEVTEPATESMPEFTA